MGGGTGESKGPGKLTLPTPAAMEGGADGTVDWRGRVMYLRGGSVGRGCAQGGVGCSGRAWTDSVQSGLQHQSA